MSNSRSMMRMVMGSFPVPAWGRPIVHSGRVQVGTTLPTQGDHELGRHLRRTVAVLVMAVGVLATALRRVVVVGDSMAPTLLPGDRLLVARVPAGVALRPGVLVAFPDPRHGPGGEAPLLVKRVTWSSGGAVEVRGDNPAASTDSRSFGTVPRDAVIGVAVYRYGPPPRRGRLPTAPARWLHAPPGR